MSGPTLKLSWPAPKVAQICLVRENEMNTLSLELLDEFNAALDEVIAAKGRVLIVTGTGRAFCCGAHLKYFAGPDAIFTERFETRDRYFERIARLFDKVEALSIPVIAAINGYALGGGFELALACDFRILSTKAKVGLPEVKLGATPGAGGVQKLARHIGRGKALEWILLARFIEPPEAEAAGIAYKVVAPEMLGDASLSLARELLKLSPQALGQCKASVHFSGDVDLRSARRFGVEALSALVDSADWREGMAAFVEKRAPAFAPVDEA